MKMVKSRSESLNEKSRVLIWGKGHGLRCVVRKLRREIFMKNLEIEFAGGCFHSVFDVGSTC